MKALIAGTMLVLAGAAGAAPNPFFVFDNGLRGEKLKTIDAQLDLVKSVGFEGLSGTLDLLLRSGLREIFFDHRYNHPYKDTGFEGRFQGMVAGLEEKEGLPQRARSSHRDPSALCGSLC